LGTAPASNVNVVGAMVPMFSSFSGSAEVVIVAEGVVAGDPTTKTVVVDETDDAVGVEDPTTNTVVVDNGPTEDDDSEGVVNMTGAVAVVDAVLVAVAESVFSPRAEMIAETAAPVIVSVELIVSAPVVEEREDTPPVDVTLIVVPSSSWSSQSSSSSPLEEGTTVAVAEATDVEVAVEDEPVPVPVAFANGFCVMFTSCCPSGIGP
jgi:hypothetical protein